jgi:hypothetical protein
MIHSGLCGDVFKIGIKPEMTELRMKRKWVWSQDNHELAYGRAPPNAYNLSVRGLHEDEAIKLLTGPDSTASLPLPLPRNVEPSVIASRSLRLLVEGIVTVGDKSFIIKPGSSITSSPDLFG